MNIKLISEDATIPYKGSEGAAGYDLYTTETYSLKPGEIKTFKTGIALSIPFGKYGRVAPRSGLAVKHGIDVLAGVIDSDYTGEILVALVNLGNNDVTLPIVKDGKRAAIAQIIFENYTNYEFTKVDDLNVTNRASAGFGSTDIKPIGKSLEDLLKQKETALQSNVQKYSDTIKERDNKLFGN